MVLFDEFDKTFDGDATNIYGQPKQERNPNKESQNKLLGLFDGVSQTKRMYVITVNEIKKVNQFMINRPGRFHYHLQFNYPSMEEVQLYLADKLKPEFHNQINLVQRFATRFELNYDSLRAIAQDLNMGYSFLETMEDLNISTSENESVRYDIAVHHTNGVICKNNVSINLMSSSFNFGYPIAPREHLHVTFSPLEIDIQNKESFTAPADQVNFQIIYDSDNEKVTEESGITISKIVFTKPSYSRNFYGKELEVNPF
jgi:hypothetical protein